jgi:thiol-disulfide isomerase/thioredoxin
MTNFKLFTTIIPAVCLSLAISACTSAEFPANNSHDNTNQHGHEMSKYHIGPITTADLLARYRVFADNKAVDESQVTDKEVFDLANQLNNKKMVVVFGTWCHDSQREVPRLLNLLDKVNKRHSEINYEIEFIAAAPFENRDPALVKKYSIAAVPTIMLFDQGQEMGRIVEYTKLSLVADITNMKL